MNSIVSRRMQSSDSAKRSTHGAASELSEQRVGQLRKEGLPHEARGHYDVLKCLLYTLCGRARRSEDDECNNNGRIPARSRNSYPNANGTLL